MSKKKVLGRGLLNLMPDTKDLAENELKAVLPEVSISDIQINPNQPRKYFAEQELEELAESIKSVGVLQPVVVRNNSEGCIYELISGERRYRACKMAGFTKIPIVVKNISRRDSLKLSIIENIQREDLSSIELAKAYENFKIEFSLNDTDLAKELGKNRATIINIMRLLHLPEKVKNYIQEKKISEGQARPLITPYKEKKLNEKTIDNLAEQIIEKRLTSRQVESLVKILQKEQNTSFSNSIENSEKEKLPIENIEQKLSNRLTSATKIKHNDKTGKGKIIIPYSNLKNMENILKILGV